MRTRSVSGIRGVSGALCAAMLLAGCAMTPTLPPAPPKYVPPRESPGESRTSNSLWSDGGSLVEDVKARRVNDLLTILVAENISGAGAADTNTGRKSSLDAGVTSFFGAPLNVGAGNGFSPSVTGQMTDDFKGTGTTNRTGRIVGTITARVVEVMPNGSLVVESRKDITINNEKQLLVLRGMIRPEDVSVANTVSSSKVADAEIYLVGDGVLQEKQKPAWFARILNVVWPF